MKSAQWQKRHELREKKLILVHCDPSRADEKDHKSWNRSSNRDRTEMPKNPIELLAYEASDGQDASTTQLDTWLAQALGKQTRMFPVSER